MSRKVLDCDHDVLQQKPKTHRMNIHEEFLHPNTVILINSVWVEKNVCCIIWIVKIPSEIPVFSFHEI
jgi:hypothetical protein